MDRALAKDVLQTLLRQGAELTELLSRIKETTEREEYLEYRAGVGEMLGIAQVDIAWRILRQHPDLMPPEWRPNEE